MTEAPCVVYWIHLPEHTDITSEGYIGITTGKLSKRFREHKSVARNDGAYPIHKAIRKYGESLVFEAILYGSEDYCLFVENALRPRPTIGWNIMIGGQLSPMVGRTPSEETRKKMSEANKRSSPELVQHRMRNLQGTSWPRTEESLIKMRKAFVDKRGGWKSPSANMQLWSIADRVYTAMMENPSFGTVKIRNMLGLDKTFHLNNLFKKIKQTNWIPLEDPEWVEWKESFKLNEKEILCS